MKVGVLTTRLFAQAANGGERCTARLLTALAAQGHEVAVMGLGEASPPQGWPENRWNCLGPGAPPFAEWSVAAKLGHLVEMAVRGQPSTLLRLGSATVRQRAASTLRSWQQWGVEALLVDHLQTWTWLAPGLWLPAPVLVMHNLESQGYAQQARQTRGARAGVLGREARLLARLEQHAARRSAAVLLLSDEDARAWRAQVSEQGAPADSLPGYPEHVSACASAASCRGRIGVIGTWSWQPNRDALHWLLHEVAPHLPLGAELWVAGRGVPSEWPGVRRPGVKVLGPVPCAAAFLQQVDVLALPSLHGSGVQEKAIEAVSTGLPVVATPHAVRGLGSGLPPQVRLAAEPVEFAQLCGEAPAHDRAHALRETVRWAAHRRASYRDRLALALERSRQAGPWCA